MVTESDVFVRTTFIRPYHLDCAPATPKTRDVELYFSAVNLNCLENTIIMTYVRRHQDFFISRRNKTREKSVE